MKRFFERKSISGFSLVEIILVIAIGAIVFAMGMIAWKKGQVGRQFDRDLDTLAATLDSARAMALKYGSDPENFSGPSSPTHQLTYPRHIARLVVNGINENDQITVLNNVKISYDTGSGYALPLGGMSQTLVDGNFRGVALMFGSESGTSYNYNSTILFNPNGSVCYTPFASPPPQGANHIKIIMESADNSKRGEIILDRNTGIVKTQRIR